MVTGADSEGHVTLSLSADQSLAADTIFPERRIILNRDKDSITIGRASKVSSKGFIAGLENAWFDSAVMSRLHAQVVANMDEQKVEVKDLGSLHGTFLNGDDRVPKKGSTELKDGDNLQMGIPIWRGAEQFAPITLKVGIRFSDRGDTPGTNTFQVPDGSEDEDEDDFSSDSDHAVKKTNGHTPAAPGKSARNTIGVVDLTNDYSGRSAHMDTDHAPFRGTNTHDVIDLSSPPSSPIHIEDDLDLASAVELHDDKMENIPDVHDESTPASPELGGHEVHENLNGMASLFGDHMRSMSDLGNTLTFATYEGDATLCNDMDGTDLDSVATESDIDYPDDEIENALDSDADGDFDSESDEDMEDMGSEDEYSSDDESLRMDSPHYDSDDPWHQTTPQSMEFPEIAMIVDSLSTPVIPAPAAKPDETAARSNAPVSIEGLLNPINTTTEIVGARSGKADFFAAREENKIVVNAQRATKPRPTSSVHALCNEEGPSSYRFGPAAGAVSDSLAEDLPRFFERMAKAIRPVHSPIVSPPPETSLERVDPFIPLADLPPAIDSTLNPDGDADCHSRRTHVGISDIVNSCHQTPDTGKMKRKADDISKTTNEQELWAADAKKANLETFTSNLDQDINAHGDNPFRAFSPTLSAAAKPQQMEPQLSVPFELADEIPSSIATSHVPERPTKRARVMRIAERVGYAALGGVTAGAMIVGTLIYTAPTFG